ncbi:MAG TPA: DUF1592 domain-containing protein, partial [Gammaproteobacteria bacterium]|nr:DUF1592 domain-containing protein [Gammaproteobacteria bacterium]
ETWERVVRKLADASMPPADNPAPAPAQYLAARSTLESALDAAAAGHPRAGPLPAFRRLTRTEYANAIRDLLAIEHMPGELDYELLLPADNASSGFDNIADLLFVSPAIMERYIGAARKIARLAVGDMRTPEMVNIHMLSEQRPQDARVDGLPLGTRGGLAVDTYLPLDAQYVVHVETARAAREPHDVELTVDGRRVALERIGADAGGARTFSGDALEFRVPLSAGPHQIGVTFVQRSQALDESTRRPRLRGRGSGPAIAMATISGPYAATGPGDTPSRAAIFSCVPESQQAEPACARAIIGRLAQRAWRRAVSDADIAEIVAFYEAGRADGGFESGIQLALERMLVSPQFLYRIERDPQSAGVAPVSDVELASRLSFFLWSSIPDDELLSLAIAGRLREPAVLRAQVDRMLADPRSGAMVNNFAAQWLFLRDVTSKEPDIFLFPDYDVTLREALERETLLFVDSVLRSDSSVTELLTAKHTFVNERLAEHYGIPNVRGSHFSRVDFADDDPRGGLLSQGGILIVTSYSTRTSPVLRGKYVLENLLASPPPPPPPDVPALEVQQQESAAPLTMREAMTRHRADPACAGCHVRMDAYGFALENFDAVGRWRDADAGLPIEAVSELPDGTVVAGIEGVRQAIVGEPEHFVFALTEKLLMYALGRNVQYYDAPAIRAIVRDAQRDEYRFSAIVHGIVTSVPFLMREARAQEDE